MPIRHPALLLRSGNGLTGSLQPRVIVIPPPQPSKPCPVPYIHTLLQQFIDQNKKPPLVSLHVRRPRLLQFVLYQFEVGVTLKTRKTRPPSVFGKSIVPNSTGVFNAAVKRPLFMPIAS